jgi:hypothetical protein
MPTLAGELRSKLERVVTEARDAAEAGARAGLQALAVDHHEPYPHMKEPAQRELRNHLRARARQLGDQRLPRPDSNGKDHEIDHLAGECAYEHWHRMLFARFLAENGLLIEPQESMAISLAEAEELAKEDGVDVWVFASRCAQQMLPQIFRPDDPLLQVSFSTEHMLKLERLLASLPQAVFTASDALGWVYQFWQSKKKDEVNRSGVKIGADEISAVTQLFTEPYMVEFLLHNTLGAWWAGKKLAAKDAASAKTEDELRSRLALPSVDWEYLRFVRGADGKGGSWRPAAGTFGGWPESAAELKVLDPCCGSGHFLVASLQHLAPIRMAEEHLSARDAVDAVLRDNLHGLEIDERCCQIAAFALAFAAWTYPDAGGYRPLPDLHIACTGIGPQATEEQWLKLAEQSGIPMPAVGRQAIKNGLSTLHRLFSQAPTLGSLINPANLSADLLTADYQTIRPYLNAIMSAEKADDETRERAIAAAGMVKAAELLASEYELVITNVPYLGRGKQIAALRAHLEARYPRGKTDLATAFVLRSLEFCAAGGALSMVTPQYWLFQGSYTEMREAILRTVSLNIIAPLGPGAFGTISGAVVNTALLAITDSRPSATSAFLGVDASHDGSPLEKRTRLVIGNAGPLLQAGQLENPDCRISANPPSNLPTLAHYADVYVGFQNGDTPRWVHSFWEQSRFDSRWEPFHATPERAGTFEGFDSALCWEGGAGELARSEQAYVKGREAWGRQGVLCRQTQPWPTSLYLGSLYDQSSSVVVPKVPSLLPATYCFLASKSFRDGMLSIANTMKFTNSTFVKVPFDVGKWEQVAAQEFPNGLPGPESGDPTQWLFHGRPEESTAPLQVAVARLLGYRWPAEFDENMRLSARARALVKRCDELSKFADEDGIVCIPSVRGEELAADRLLALLDAAGVKPARVRELAGSADLEDWLRSRFFEEHCKLFHDRPFVWHIWDGRKGDGFHALVNYHKLCEGKGKGRKLLESLTYSYLVGDWITRQKDGVKRGEGGAEDRLAAALELQKRLEAILEGEPPFDLFVRWKPLAEQPIGWEPDINNGVRMNIRPFLASDLPSGRTGAGVLRWRPNIKWDKDRGKETDRPKAEFPWFLGWDQKTEDFIGGKTFDGNRWNDCHYTNEAKQASRDAANAKKSKTS